MKHMRKRILSLLLAMAMLLTLLPTVALAEDETDQLTDAETWAEIEPPLQDTEVIVVPDDYVPDGIVMDYDPPMLSDGDTLNYEITLMLSLCSEVKAALLSGESTTKISLSDTDLVSGETEQFHHIGYYCPYADGSNINLTLYHYTDGSYAYIEITNTLSADETAAWIAKIDAKLAELSALISDSSLSVADQALILHDYMDAHYHYAQPIRNPNDYYPGVMLTENQGVCQAYAYLFQYIMNSKGIECYTACSSSMNHAWNIIGFDGNYYQIDITWDDPVNDYYGMARHEYFLLSDTTMSDSTHEHSGWDLTNYACTDTTYESAYFVSATSPVVLQGDDRYYVTANEGLVKYASGATTELNSLGKWYSSSGGYYLAKYTGLWADHGKLFYNTATQILSYDLANGATAVVTTADTSSGYIYGSVYGDHDCDGDVEISYELSTAPSVAYASKNLQEVSYTPVHDYDSGVVTTAAGCLTEGVTTYTCLYCDDVYTAAISPSGHTPGTAVTENVKAATCTEAGQQDSVVYCTVCNAELSRSTAVLPATGHNYENGTCTACGAKDPAAIKVPACTVSAAKGTSSRKITITGQLSDYANLSDYNITGHGLIYITATKLGSKTLTINTSGRTKVSFSSYKADGSFSYTFTGSAVSTKYVCRTWVSYVDGSGNTVYVYSDPITVSYSTLN